ncbi:hypothetical protein TVAG_441330 [Trichomonas vaginalis G3]|uniref:Uncharacterized protein n=1 Tax=Trichomonas vaginalis (strain ATCC PRA-98 / G3) TaxID=412133 RepID=A2FF89_TRIV3|nr:hypothetical protein TVAGG3_0878760 [Trichomonas vaginalis G3]EAX96419.1 hypothetical protein TVAG_441330 [Trichomonas vaginalis G3]KAI5501889.1 hypothetical protein TVAGG3_0878760 [Trichomonas vaginalis G3]|eukprot:XP_001309349.1 hypothetical protein [Trichomonas vaginalis G3]
MSKEQKSDYTLLNLVKECTNVTSNYKDLETSFTTPISHTSITEDSQSEPQSSQPDNNASMNQSSKQANNSAKESKNYKFEKHVIQKQTQSTINHTQSSQLTESHITFTKMESNKTQQENNSEIKSIKFKKFKYIRKAKYNDIVYHIDLIEETTRTSENNISTEKTKYYYLKGGQRKNIDINDGNFEEIKDST